MTLKLCVLNPPMRQWLTKSNISSIGDTLPLPKALQSKLSPSNPRVLLAVPVSKRISSIAAATTARFEKALLGCWSTRLSWRGSALSRRHCEIIRSVLQGFCVGFGFSLLLAGLTGSSSAFFSRAAIFQLRAILVRRSAIQTKPLPKTRVKPLFVEPRGQTISQ